MDRLHRQRLGAVLALGVWAVVCLGAVGVRAAPDDDLPRLRTLDRPLASLIQQGIEQSATFRRLVDGVQRSDLIVHIERHGRFRDGQSGSFQLVSSRGGQRYVRIGLSTALNARELIVLLAHELQHANELADAPHVFDLHGMREFYCSIGEHSRFGDDTEVARQVTEQVSAELASRPDR